MRTSLKLSAVLAAAVAAPVLAAPVVDGTADAVYGPAIVVQSVQTQFGNSTSGGPLFANGSELDGGYATIANGNLYLLLSGNLESNFNKLEIYIDSQAGGQNTLRNDNADVDFNGLNRQAGLTFDARFSADHYFTVTGGNTGTGYQLFANYARLLTGGGGSGGFIAGSAVDGNVLSGNAGGSTVTIAINNSNVLGVGGGTAADSGAGVLTGVELEIPLTLLGVDSSTILVSAFINGGGHDFVSNQVLGGLPGGTSNLGEPANVNFGSIAGDQFFAVVVPEPAALSLLAMPALALVRRRK